MIVNALITGTGGGVGQSIFKALKLSDLSLNLFTTDMHPMGVGIYRGKKGFLVPAAQDSLFIPRIIEICNLQNIDIVFVGSDPELPVFASEKARIEKETGAKVIVGTPEQIKIGNDKWETYQFLKQHNLPYPESALPADCEALIENIGFPIIIKPREGSASRDVYVVKNQEELKVLLKRVKDPIIQEYLLPDDEEYTSGAMMMNGKLLGILTMKREIKGGNTYRGIVDTHQEVRDAVTFEINPRFSGTTGMRAYFRFNEPEAVINALFYNKTPAMQHTRGIVMRYMNEVYVPLEEREQLSRNKSIEGSQSRIIDYF
jgi:carbamoyl-phosphate synthase large subunit